MVKHAETCLKRKNTCLGEEACKQSLILPFISLLGYDIFDTGEVNPEYAADFSDKYKNRVDYAILKDGEAVIAIECKQAVEKTDRGQLKAYFNACKSVKLGVLTDGIVYEFFADCDTPNYMDDNPFLRFDLKDFADGHIADEQAKAILTFAKSEFDPDNVGAEAKKKVIFSSIINFLECNLIEPTDDFKRYLLKNAEGINQRITEGILKENQDVVKTALQGFIDKCILDRVGLADKRVIKIEEKKEEDKEGIVSLELVQSDVVTTEAESHIYEYTKQRLAFLVDTDDLYQGLRDVLWEDYKTVFTVYYKKVRNGRLFNFVENKDGTVTFNFPSLEDSVTCEQGCYKDLDKYLLESYKKAFAEVH